MPTIAFCDESDLSIALGGDDVLVQLADRDGDGIADPTVVVDYLESGAGTVRAAVEVKHEPEAIALLDASSLRHLRDLNKWLSASIAWLEGCRGQAIPQRISEQRDWVNEELDKIRTSERRLGRVAGGTVIAMSQPVGVVDFDPLACGISVAGFKRGFR